MDLFDIAVARKLSSGSGGGGGGDSDFSIAQVTLTIGTGGDYIYLCVAVDNGGFPFTVGGKLQESGTYSAVLYKGGALAEIPSGFEYTATGSVQDYGGGMLFITGDCTITIS